MGQKRIDHSGNESEFVRLSNIDANFDDLFDIMTVLDADYNFVAKSGFQQLFNSSPNGALNLPAGLFGFESLFNIENMSLTNGSFGFNLGGSAPIESQAWLAFGRMGTETVAAATVASSTYNYGSQSALTSFSMAGLGWAWLRGVFRLSATGTVIPQVSFTTFAGAIPVVKKNSFFRAKKLGNTYTASLIAPPTPLPSSGTPFWS